MRFAETEEGFIWIGSYSGLIRYDGNNFERVDSVFHRELHPLSVCMWTAKTDSWIGINDNGVVVMDRVYSPILTVLAA